jgi:hypothetical protein
MDLGHNGALSRLLLADQTFELIHYCRAGLLKGAAERAIAFDG